MTAIATYRMATEAATPVPSRGTYPSAADQLFYGLTLVSVDGDGNAVVPEDGDGFAVCGVANATYDNRTGSEAGGLAGSLDIEVQFGVFGFNYTGTAPEPGQVLFVVDNQTVSVDSDSGQRGIAGYCVEVRTNTAGTAQAYLQIGPAIAGQIVIAAAEAADLDQAQLDIDALEDDVSALQDSALTAQACLPIPITAFRIYSSGGALIPFNDGVADGIDATAESIGFKFNVASTAAIAASVLMPNDLDDAADVVVHVLGYRVGASDVTAALTVAAFFRVAGAAFSADADAAAGDTSAFAAATTVVSEVTKTILAADVPAAPCSLLLTLVPTAALDADDLVILEVWIEYTRKLLTA